MYTDPEARYSTRVSDEALALRARGAQREVGDDLAQLAASVLG